MQPRHPTDKLEGKVWLQTLTAAGSQGPFPGFPYSLTTKFLRENSSLVSAEPGNWLGQRGWAVSVHWTPGCWRELCVPDREGSREGSSRTLLPRPSPPAPASGLPGPTSSNTTAFQCPKAMDMTPSLCSRLAWTTPGPQHLLKMGPAGSPRRCDHVPEIGSSVTGGLRWGGMPGAPPGLGGGRRGRQGRTAGVSQQERRAAMESSEAG